MKVIKRGHFERIIALPRPENAAAHAIGLDYKAPYSRHGKMFYKPYRNYFGAPECGSRIWEEIEDKGRALRDRDGIYHLTRDGLDWLGKELGITIHDEV
ncbi:MAG: hypothetical protein RR296_10485 [Clostridia bacterium]